MPGVHRRVEQISSYNSQLQYYKDYISKNPEWTMVGIYADKASLEPRPMQGRTS